MAYSKKPYMTPSTRAYGRRAMSGYRNVRSLYPMGGASDCGPDQVWDPNFVYMPGTSYSIKGQCVTPAQQAANQQAHPEQYSSGGGGGGGSTITDLLTGLAAGLRGNTAQAPVVMPQQSGVSTTTLIVGGVALVGLALILRRRD